jgi:hypothetical protein
MSFFDRQEISEFLVRNRAQIEGDCGSQSQHDQNKERGNREESDKNDMSDFSEDDEFENDVQVFRNYSFILCDTNRTFEMHAFVQLTMRK